ncbi:hypothetical protein D3C73_1432360 [compost metagenome]
MVGLAHQVGLRIGAGYGQARLAAIRVDGGAGHNGQNVVAVRERLVVVLKQENAAAFGPDIPIARCVEHIAPAVRR